MQRCKILNHLGDRLAAIAPGRRAVELAPQNPWIATAHRVWHGGRCGTNGDRSARYCSSQSSVDEVGRTPCQVATVEDQTDGRARRYSPVTRSPSQNLGSTSSSLSSGCNDGQPPQLILAVQTIPANPLIGNGRRIENTSYARRRANNKTGYGATKTPEMLDDSSRRAGGGYQLARAARLQLFVSVQT